MSRIHASSAANGGAAQRQLVPDRGPIGQRQRALVAMARAVGRARDPTDADLVANVSTEPTHYRRPTPETRNHDVGVALTRQGVGAASRPPRGMRLVITAELAALVALLTTFVVVRVAGVDARPRAVSSAGVAQRKVTTSPASTSTVPAAPVLPPSTTAAAPASSPNAPVLSALSPPQGGAGVVVAVSGTNLFSADGQVVTRFGAQVAPTQCPTQTTCTVTVPTLSGAPSTVPVTVTTSSGTSNTLLFTYQLAAQPTAQVAPNNHQDPGQTTSSGAEGHGKHPSGDGGDG